MCIRDRAYTDECDLGHQFEPEELIAPKSALTGETPCLLYTSQLVRQTGKRALRRIEVLLRSLHPALFERCLLYTSRCV